MMSLELNRHDLPVAPCYILSGLSLDPATACMLLLKLVLVPNQALAILDP